MLSTGHKRADTSRQSQGICASPRRGCGHDCLRTRRSGQWSRWHYAKLRDRSDQLCPPSPAPDAAPQAHTSRHPLVVPLVFVYVLAAVVRMGYVESTRYDPISRDLAKGTDMEVFDRIARDVLRGNWLAGSASDSPLYPCVFLPALYSVTAGDAHGTAILQGAFAALLACIVFLVARELYGQPAALLAGLLIALYAPLIVYDTVCLGEVVLNVLAAACLLALLWAGDKPTRLRCAGAGVLLGLAAAAKPTTLPFAALGLLWLGFVLRGSRREMWSALCVTALAAALAIVPFLVRTKCIEGRLFAVRGNSGIIFLMGNNPTATGGFGYPRGEFGARFRSAAAGKPLAERDAAAYRLAFEFIRREPARALMLTLKKLAQFLSAPEPGNNLSPKRQLQVSFLSAPWFVGYGALLPLACIGLAVGGCRPRDRCLLAAYLAAHTAVIVAFIVLARYRLIIVPALAVFAGRGLTYIGSCARRRQWRRTAIALAALACLGIAVNRAWLVRRYTELRHADGFRSVVGRRVVIRDDSGRGTRFGVTLTEPSKIVRKTLVLPQSDYERGQRFQFVGDAAVDAGTQWTLSVNGTSTSGPMWKEDRRHLAASVPQKWLRPGPNTFEITVSSGRIRIALDDRFDFDRSAVSVMGQWRTDWLDTDTCARYRSLWIANGELKARLEVVLAQ